MYKIEITILGALWLFSPIVGYLLLGWLGVIIWLSGSIIGLIGV